jgi:4-hydroxybenzoate polyprenyltransferase
MSALFTKFRQFGSNLREWAEMVRLEHTVFALPFALAGLILAKSGLPSVSVFLWTILAFAGARAAAMTVNRVIDAKIDALNPRTSDRAIPAGRISFIKAQIAVLVAFALMIFAAAHLPKLCLTLSPIAVIWLSFYSFTKRFTWLCHIVLGIALGGAVLGGWLAAGGTLTVAAPWLLALAVSCWVAGFDIIYALQDVQFDREQKLHSIPARFGLERALLISSFLHVLTVIGLVSVGLTLGLGLLYWIGVALVAGMLIYEHSLISASDLSKINAAFFNVNGVVSILTFVIFLLDKIIRHA